MHLLVAGIGSQAMAVTIGYNHSYICEPSNQLLLVSARL